ncbi:MAG TPA: hypothetical protein VFI61_00995 [Patescibacteria group bacterium]|nr:hypothetical protein [Patescibacteria group bacterium]
MAITLNLLPPELAVDKKLGSLLKGVRAMGIILLALFLVFILGVGGIFVVSTISLRSTNASLDQLKVQISSQEKTEQKLVLLKDRIKNIGVVNAKPGSLKSLNSIEPLLLTLSPDSTVTELNIDPVKVSLTINFRSNQDLSDFFENITKSEQFKSVILSSFGYNPGTGYLAGITILNQ